MADVSMTSGLYPVVLLFPNFLITFTGIIQLLHFSFLVLSIIDKKDVNNLTLWRIF